MHLTPFLPFLRPALHLWWRFSRGMTLGVRGAVFNTNGEIFLVRHTYTPGWHLPGGGVEPGQTLLEALATELREEACVALLAPPVLHGIFFNRSVSRRDHVAVFYVRDFEVQGEKQPDAEIAEARFFPLQQLPEGTTQGTLRRLKEIRGECPISAEW